MGYDSKKGSLLDLKAPFFTVMAHSLEHVIATTRYDEVVVLLPARTPPGSPAPTI